MFEQPVLLVTKKSFYERYGLEKKDPHFNKLIGQDDQLAAELMQEYEKNREAIATVEEYLLQRPVSYVKTTARETTGVGTVDGRFGLVVALGGDGTLLAASHSVVSTPLVGVNTRPGRSIGHFCAADRRDFPSLLDSILDGRRKPVKLLRLDLSINGERKPIPVLNDLLFTGANPGASTVYRISLGDTVETHRSSGLWISTPAGSTGGICAAGGARQELYARRLQFKVREPYRGIGLTYALEQGTFQDGLSITNLTPEAQVFVDGSRIFYKLNYGDIVEAKISQSPLMIYL